MEGSSATAAPGVQYPPAIASHEQVLVNRDLFFQTLRQLHSDLGATLKVPNVCSRELDLHLLYSQVVALGMESGYVMWGSLLLLVKKKDF